MKIIAASAQARMGKDTLCDYLALKLKNWNRVSFAKEVKAIFCSAFNVSPEFMEEWKTQDSPPPGFQKTVRQSLQFIGDGFRKIQFNIWVELCFRRNQPPMIISDARYLNELSKVRELGGCNIAIFRPDKLNDDQNGSEAQIRPVLEYFHEYHEEGPISLIHSFAPAGAEFIDFFIRNDSDLENFYAKIDKILVPYLDVRFGN